MWVLGIRTLVFKLAWQVILVTESSPPSFVGELFCFLLLLHCFFFFPIGSGVLCNFILAYLFCVCLERLSQNWEIYPLLR